MTGFNWRFDPLTGLPAGGTSTGIPVTIKKSGAYGGGTFLIPNGTSSGLIPSSIETRVAGLQIPPAFTGTTISFLVSLDGITYGTFKQGGAAVSIAVAAGDAVDLLGTYPGLTAWPYVQVVSNANEASDRTLTYVTV